MGLLLSKKSNLNNVNQNLYLLGAKDAKAIEKLWKIIGNDSSYYGWIFSGILFRNHPQYVKYFHDENIPEFIEDAKIKKKFSAIYSITSALFINYLKKPNQRDYVLGYIAMIHKDMHLSSQDLENFMMDILEMLTQERPNMINNRYRDFIVQYLGGLLRRIEYLMEVYRNSDFRMEGFKKSQKRNCGSKSCCDSPTIYGSSIEFWIARKEYWQNRLAIWYPLEKDLTVLEKAEKAYRMENVKFNFSQGTSNFVFRNRKSLLKTTSHATIDTTNSESASNNILQDDVNTRKKDRRRSIRHSMLLSTTGPMELIPKASSSALINIKSPPRFKNAPKNTRAFLDAVKALKNSSVHSEAKRNSNESCVKRTTIIDTARERKRARDKKFNAMHSTSDLRQTMNSKTLITGKAEKFAQALAKRRAHNKY